MEILDSYEYMDAYIYIHDRMSLQTTFYFTKFMFAFPLKISSRFIGPRSLAIYFSMMKRKEGKEVDLMTLFRFVFGKKYIAKSK